MADLQSITYSPQVGSAFILLKTKQVTFGPGELTPFQVVEIHMDGEAREPATLSVRFDGDPATLPASTLVDFYLFDKDRIPPDELERSLPRQENSAGMSDAIA